MEPKNNQQHLKTVLCLWCVLLKFLCCFQGLTALWKNNRIEGRNNMKWHKTTQWNQRKSSSPSSLQTFSLGPVAAFPMPRIITDFPSKDSPLEGISSYPRWVKCFVYSHCKHFTTISNFQCFQESKFHFKVFVLKDLLNICLTSQVVHCSTGSHNGPRLEFTISKAHHCWLGAVHQIDSILVDFSNSRDMDVPATPRRLKLQPQVLPKLPRTSSDPRNNLQHLKPAENSRQKLTMTRITDSISSELTNS